MKSYALKQICLYVSSYDNEDLANGCKQFGSLNVLLGFLMGQN